MNIYQSKLAFVGFIQSFLRVGYCLMITVFASTALSQDKLYQCTVKQILEVNDSGVLVPMKGLGATHIGDTFTINRETGELWGTWINTKYAKSFRLVDKGGNSNNLKITGEIQHWHPTVFFLDVVDSVPKQVYAFSGFFKYHHIAGTCK